MRRTAEGCGTESTLPRRPHRGNTPAWGLGLGHRHDRRGCAWAPPRRPTVSIPSGRADAARAQPRVGRQLRSTKGLVVHRREGAPLTVIAGRPATTREWTAIEVARGLRRPRSLATLDAALRSRTCDRGKLTRDPRPAVRPSRRRHRARNAISGSPLWLSRRWKARPAWSCSTADCRPPVLQYEIVDLNGRVWAAGLCLAGIPRRRRIRRRRLAQRARCIPSRPHPCRGSAGSGTGSSCRSSPEMSRHQPAQLVRRIESRLERARCRLIRSRACANCRHPAACRCADVHARGQELKR